MKRIIISLVLGLSVLSVNAQVFYTSNDFASVGNVFQKKIEIEISVPN